MNTILATILNYLIIIQGVVKLNFDFIKVLHDKMEL